MFVVNPVMPCAWCPILHQTLICALIYQIKSNGYFVLFNIYTCTCMDFIIQVNNLACVV